MAIQYGVPNRVSQRWAERLLAEFLAVPSGGTRLQAVSLAVFRTVGAAFSLFDSVETSHVNTADMASGSVADLECRRAGKMVLAVEVKDRGLRLRDIEEKLPGARERGVAELIYLVSGGVEHSETPQVESLITSEFASGQNVYVAEFVPFVKAVLILLAEPGRRDLLRAVGTALDEHADLAHREHWRDLLKTPQT